MTNNKQFQNPDFRFVQIVPGEKRPMGENWQQNGKPFDHPNIQNHNGPIGLIFGPGNVRGFDYDDCEMITVADNGLPATLRISATEGRALDIFLIDDAPQTGFIRLKRADDFQMGELRLNGVQSLVFGKHPSGRDYKVIRDVPIARIPWQKVFDVFGPWMASERKKGNLTAQLSEETDDVCRQIKERVKLSDVMTLYGIDTSKSPGKCPWHHCSNDCFSWNDGKGLWHCFDTECLRSGNIFHLVMQMESCDFPTAKGKLLKMTQCRTEEREGDGWERFFKIVRRGKHDVMVFVPQRLGNYIMNEMPFITLKDNNRMYRYTDGVYWDDGEATIKTRTKELLGEKFSSHNQNETIAYIRASTYRRNDEINYHDWVNLNNGLLNPLTKEFREHTPEIFTIGRVPITFNPDAQCPLWLEKLNEKSDPRTISVLQEMFGYMFQRGQKYEVAFLFYGPPRTMKSTILYVAEQVIGTANIRAFSLQNINDDHFSVAYLYGKRANICADLDSYSLKSTGKFMQITGGDLMTAGRKHEHAMDFYPDCKLLFSCNIIPGTTNKDLAFYRRWILLEFNKQTDPANIDTEMKQKLVAELPGILNWALEGLQRLEGNKGFSYWLTPIQVKDLYERNSDSVTSFILNNIELSDEGDKITKRQVYAEYANYCNRLRLNRLNPVWFGRDFLAATGCGSSKLSDIPAYVGVRFKGPDTTCSGLRRYGG